MTAPTPRATFNAHFVERGTNRFRTAATVALTYGTPVSCLPVTAVPRPCLSVVVPCYNEESTIVELLTKVAESPWVCEIVVVDDGSLPTAGVASCSRATPTPG